MIWGRKGAREREGERVRKKGGRGKGGCLRMKDRERIGIEEDGVWEVTQWGTQDKPSA